MSIWMKFLTAIFSTGFFFAGCQPERLAGGGGSEVEGITVEGVAYYPTGMPASSARVRIRPWDYLPLDSDTTLGAGEWRFDLATDSSGRFRADGLVPGEYLLEVDDGLDWGMVGNIRDEDLDGVVRISAEMKPHGSVYGRVTDSTGDGIAGAWVAVYGLERATETDGNGFYQLQSLPAGNLNLRAIAAEAGLASREKSGVKVEPEKATQTNFVVERSLTNGLIGHWTFDGGDGPLAAEAHGSTARVDLKRSNWGPGVMGAALDLTGQSTVYVPESKSAMFAIDKDSDFSVSLWFRTSGDSGAAKRTVLIDSRSQRCPSGYGLRLLANGTVEFVVRGLDQAKIWKLRSPEGLTDGSWHHVTGMKVADSLKLWVDGIPVATGPGSTGKLATGNRLHFGNQEGLTEFFMGSLDEIRIYNRALTKREIMELAVLPKSK